MVRLDGSELDPIALARRGSECTPVVWENIEDNEQWICGCRPIYDRQSRTHWVTLQPGQFSEFIIPPRAMVRIVAGNGEDLSSQDVCVWISEGSFAYKELKTANSVDGKSVVAIPDSFSTAIGRVTCPEYRTACLKVAIYTSRHIALEDVDTWQCPLPGCGYEVTIDYQDGSTPSRWSTLAENDAIAIDVVGPTWVRTQARHNYRPTDTYADQPFKLYASIDGQLTRVIDCEPSLEQYRRAYVDGVDQTVSTIESGYVLVPAGHHRLTIESTACCLFRAHCCDQNLCRRINRSGWSLQPRSLEQFASVWEIQDDVVTNQFAIERNEPSLLRLALRSARDNRYRHGGVRGYELLRAAAANRPDQPQIASEAQKLRSSYTYYRNILPLSGAQPLQHETAYFIRRRLRNSSADYADVHISESMIDEGLRHVSEAKFSLLSSDATNPNRYYFPPDAAPTHLRLVVRHNPTLDSNSTVWVQLGESPPQRVLIKPVCSLGQEHFILSIADAAITALQWQHRETDLGTISGPFALHKDPGVLCDVGTVEFRLQESERHVSVWCDNPDTQVAVQLRVSKPYQLTEQSYRNSVGRLKIDEHGLLDLFAEGQNSNYVAPVADPIALVDLQNHWLPLRRRLESLVKSLERGKRSKTPDTTPWSAADSGTLEVARSLINKREWLPALEAWSRIVDRLPEDVRAEGVNAKTRCLWELNERYLWMTELTGYFLFNDDPAVREFAAETLIQNARYDRDAEQTAMRVLATQIMRDKSFVAATRLAAMFFENGEIWQALQLLLLVPRDQRPHELVCKLALKERWWRSYSDAVDALPSEPLKHFYTALYSLRSGCYQQAESQFAQSGDAGSQFLAHWNWGKEILRGLRSADLHNRLRAIEAWEHYSDQYPGSRVWSSADTRVASTAGNVTVESQESGALSDYHLASPERPLEVEVQGPTRLRVQARPLFASMESPELDGWISVDVSGRKHVIAVQNSYPRDNTKLLGLQGMAAGVTVEKVIALGPGRHRLKVKGDGFSLIARVELERPEFLLPVLPPLSPAVVDLAVAGNLEPTKTILNTRPATKKRRLRPPMQVRILPSDCNRPPVYTCATRHCFAKSHLKDLPPLAAFRVREMRLDGAQQLLSMNASLVSETVARELLSRFGTINDLLGKLESYELDVVDVVAGLMARGANATAAELCEKHFLANSEVSRHTNVALAFLISQMPDANLRMTARMFEVDRATPEADLLRSITQSGFEWRSLREFQQSAGIHQVPIDGWSPESHQLRVRSALSSRAGDIDFSLTASNEAHIDVVNTRTQPVEIAFSRAQLSYLQQNEFVEVRWRVDDGPPESIHLPDSPQPQTIRIPVDDGRHQLVLWTVDSNANHFVHAKMTHIEPAVTPNGQQLGITRQRLYHVATRDEPVRFTVFGPTVVRIDEFDPGQAISRSRHVAVKESQREITLHAGHGADRLYRVSELVRADRESPPVFRVPEVTQPLPTAWIDTNVQVTSIANHSSAVYTSDWITANFIQRGDRLTSFHNVGDVNSTHLNVTGLDRWLPLGSHEDGTWEIGTELTYRQAVEESDFGNAADRYAEAFATRYFFDRWQDKHYRDKYLARYRDDAGASFGWVHDEWWTASSAKERPFGLHWNTTAYAQVPGGPVSSADSDLEWSLGTKVEWRQRFTITETFHHDFTATAFGRIISLDENKYKPGRVDQDVFTPYKRNHPAGFRFVDRYVYERCEDSKWWVSPAVATNTDFNPLRPDYVTVRTGWSQMLGDVKLEVAYRWGRFFADEDRRSSTTQHLIFADVTLERWRSLGRRWEIGLRVRQDLEDEGGSAFVTISDFRSHGREYRDFHSSQLPFGSLRRQRAIDDWLSGTAQTN